MTTAKTVRVAILGGGMAGVAAAWQLVQNPTPGIVYDITIYEATWRLGGKCASGRDATRGYRIEEHGIHILMGFYSQVFRILRDSYATLSPSIGYPTFENALLPSDLLQLPENVNGQWTFWPITFPTNGRKPGSADPAKRDLLGALATAKTFLEQWRDRYEALHPTAKPLAALLRNVFVPAPTGAPKLDALSFAKSSSATDLKASLTRLLSDAAPPASASSELRHLWMAIYFGAANLMGIVADGLFTPEAFQGDAINAQGYKAWLKSHAGEFPSKELTWDSPIVNAVYDLVFSHDVDFAAGAAAYDVLLMLLDYAGHVFYRMAGTGEVVFGPLYFALKQKGVHFRFGNTVTDVKVGTGASGSPEVTSFELQGDDTEWTVDELFVKVDGQPCWPSAPLVNKPVKPIVRTRADFDYVVSAIPIGALRESAPSMAALPPIAHAIDSIVTVPTQSIQLWFDQTLADMGWASGTMMLGSFARPFNSCADMFQVLPEEHWAGEKSVLYMSDVYDGTVVDPVAAKAIVKDRALSWIEHDLPSLIPSFTWDRLIDPAGSLGSNRFTSQYWRANVTGTELYVASAPGTVAARLSATGAGVANLLLASDWVLTEENQGCVEGAARSGTQAAVALAAAAAASTVPTYVQRDGDWALPHPVLLTGAQAKAVPLLASGAALDALCAQISIAGAAVRPWLADVPLVLVFACGCDDITSNDPAYAAWGSLSEREVGVFVPVVVESGGTSFTALYCAYLYVDNGATLVCGRETYGIPKELVTFSTWDITDAPPLPLDVNGLALVNQGDPASQQPLVKLSGALLGATAPTHDHGTVRGWLDKLWADLGGGAVSVPLVMLKQFHAIENGSSACYQKLVRCEIQPSNVDVSFGVGLVSVELPSYFFPQIAKTLGLPERSLSVLAVESSLDFVLSVGDVVAG